MRKFLLLTAAMLTFSAMPQNVMAEEGVEHYAAAEGTTVANAKSVVVAKIAEVETFLKAEKLDELAFEAIHENSYTIEDAAAKMTGDTVALKAAIEELHLSSEDHKEAELRAAFTKIQTELKKL